MGLPKGSSSSCFQGEATSPRQVPCRTPNSCSNPLRGCGQNSEEFRQFMNLLVKSFYFHQCQKRLIREPEISRRSDPPSLHTTITAEKNEERAQHFLVWQNSTFFLPNCNTEKIKVDFKNNNNIRWPISHTGEYSSNIVRTKQENTGILRILFCSQLRTLISKLLREQVATQLFGGTFPSETGISGDLFHPDIVSPPTGR